MASKPHRGSDIPRNDLRRAREGEPCAEELGADGLVRASDGHVLGDQGKRDGKNIEDTRSFALNLVDKALAPRVFECVKYHGAERGKKLGIHLHPSKRVNAPLIEECPANIECELHSTLEAGSGYIVIGKIVGCMVREDITGLGEKERYEALAPAFFLEDELYATLAGAERANK